MSYPKPVYQLAEGVRINAEHFQRGFVYTPGTPELFELNLSALYLLAELEKGEPNAIIDAFVATTAKRYGSEATARRHAEEGLKHLEQAGIIELVEPSP